MSPLRRRLSLAVPAGAVIVTGCVLAGTMLASAAAPKLPHRTPAQLLAGLRNAKLPSSMTAVLSEKANFGLPSLPDGMMPSSATSALSLLTGTHTVDIWYAGPEHLRVALPVPFGETDLRVNGGQIWLWNSHGQTATHVELPSLPARGRIGVFRPVPGGKPVPGSAPANGSRPIRGAASAAKRAAAKRAAAKPATSKAPVPAKPKPGRIAALTPLQWADRVLAMLGPTTKVSVAGTVTVAGRPAYQLAIAPRTGQSLVGRVLIAVDAKTYLPLQVQVFARGSSSAAFQIGFTSLSFSRPSMSNFTFTPPPGAHLKVVKLPAGLPGQLPGPMCAMATVGGPGTTKPGTTKPGTTKPGTTKPGTTKPGTTKPSGALPRVLPRALPCGIPQGAVAPRIFGSGWLTVAALPIGPALTPESHLPLPQMPGGSGATPDGTGKVAVGPAGQLPGLFGLLMKASTKVHGSWGSGRLLRTSLLSVLITSKGEVLAGAVTPAVLFADAAKVK